MNYSATLILWLERTTLLQKITIMCTSKKVIKGLRVYVVFKYCWATNVMANSRQKKSLFLQDEEIIRVLTGSDDQKLQTKCVSWAAQLTHHLLCRAISYRLYYPDKVFSYMFSNSPMHFCVNRFVPYSFFHLLFHIH